MPRSFARPRGLYACHKCAFFEHKLPLLMSLLQTESICFGRSLHPGPKSRPSASFLLRALHYVLTKCKILRTSARAPTAPRLLRSSWRSTQMMYLDFITSHTSFISPTLPCVLIVACQENISLISNAGYQVNALCPGVCAEYNNPDEHSCLCLLLNDRYAM